MIDLKTFSDDQYLRLPQILKIIPVSRSTWYRGIQIGIYPKPVKVSTKVSAWKVQTLRECLTAREVSSKLAG